MFVLYSVVSAKYLKNKQINNNFWKRHMSTCSVANLLQLRTATWARTCGVRTATAAWTTWRSAPCSPGPAPPTACSSPSRASSGAGVSPNLNIFTRIIFHRTPNLSCVIWFVCCLYLVQIARSQPKQRSLVWSPEVICEVGVKHVARGTRCDPRADPIRPGRQFDKMAWFLISSLYP